MRKKRLGVIILIITGFIFFCGLGYLLGTTVNTTLPTSVSLVSSTPELKAALSTADSIAIVNLDNGITIQGEKINYGTKMLEYSNDKFLAAGLEDARQGIQNGKYASYIIIPSTFSESVVSVNGTPKKAVLEYVMSNQLTGEATKTVCFEIANFEKLLNDNLGYMYIYSILDEFHNAQDKAETIMNNDKKDLEVLQSISSVNLVELVSTPDISLPVSKIENLDVSGNFLINQQIIEDVSNQYKYDINSSAEDFMLIREEGIDMTENLKDSKEIINGIDIETNIQGVTVYKEGVEYIESYIGGYNTSLDDNKSSIIDLVKDIRDNGTLTALAGAEELFKEQIKNIAALILGYQDSCIEDLRVVLTAELPEEELPEDIIIVIDYNAIREVAANYITNAGDLDSYMDEIQPIIEGEIDRILELKINAFQEKLNVQMENFASDLLDNLVIIDISEVSDGQEDNYITVLENLDNVLLVDQDEISDSIENKILEPIREQQEYTKDTLMEDYSLRLADAKNLNDSLDYYRPEAYINENKVNLLMTNMHQNHKGLETSVESQRYQYSNYISDLYKSAQDGINGVSQTIVQANETSKEKVTQGLEAAKVSRKTNNEINQALLQDFTSQLSYTRLGSMEYTQVYEFIVNPLNLSDLSELPDNTKIQPLQVASAHPATATGGQSPTLLYLLGGILFVLVLFVINRIVQLIKNSKKN